MTRFTSLLCASLVVVFIASIVHSSDAATQYVNGATIFGRCANFSIQGATTVSFAGAQTNIISGHVGDGIGSSITGTPLFGKGYTEQSDTSAALNCVADEGTAYLYLKGLTCTNTLANSDLSGVTLNAGVYCTGSGVLTLKTGNLTLDAQGDANAQFVFQTATTLITSTDTSIFLVNGALCKNVFWQVGSSATLGLSSSFVGQILAYASISVGTTVTVVGRLYAQAAVTFAGGDIISLPSQN